MDPKVVHVMDSASASKAEASFQAPSKRKTWELYSDRDRRVFSLVLFLVGTSNYVDRNLIGVVLEQIKAEFHASDTMLGLLTGMAFALLYATLGIPVARWADRGDRKLVISLSLLIWSVMTVACGLAGSLWQLAAARFGVGAGEAGAVPPAQSLLVDYYPQAERARAIGIFVTSSAAGYVLGLVVGGVVAEKFGWRAAFIIFGLAGVALSPLVHFVLKEPRRSGLGASTPGAAESPTAAIRALWNKAAYRNILASIVVYYLIAYGALIFVVSLMIRSYGLSVAEAGGIFGAILAIGAVVGSFGGGMLAERAGRSDVTSLTSIGGWGMIVAAPFYELALWSPSLGMMIPMLFLGAILLNGAVPPAFSALHVVCGSKRRAFSVALTYFFANLVGLGLGPMIAGVLSDYFGATHGSADGLRLSLLLVMSLLIPAGWLMLRAGRSMTLDAED